MTNGTLTGYFFWLCLLPALASCNKDKYPGVKITSPVNGQVFTAPETIHVSADMVDDGDILLGESLFVVKVLTNDTIVKVLLNEEVAYYTLKKDFTSEPNTTYKIVAKSRGGHGNTATDSVLIKTN